MVTRGGRATTAATGISLLVHAALVASLAHRPQRSATAGLESPAVTVDLVATTLAEPPAPSAPVPAPAKGRGAIRSPVRRLARVVTSFAPDSQITTIASPDTGDPREEDEEETPAPPPAPAVARAEEEPVVPPTQTPIIAPDTARALRVYDTYPMLLAQAALTRAEVLVEVCVSDHGQVSDAVIAQGGMDSIDHTLRTAIRSWRYRPLLVNGAPTPFCHFMRIKYALN